MHKLSELRELDLRIAATPFDDLEVELKEKRNVLRWVNSLVLKRITAKREPQEESRLHYPPGVAVAGFLRFVFSKRAFDSVFAQGIVDMRIEYVDAIASGYMWKARWVVFRDHLGLALTTGAYLGTVIVKKVTGIWRMIS